MEVILLKPPYIILFGRISIEKPTQKPKQQVNNDHIKKDLNEDFYEGLMIDWNEHIIFIEKPFVLIKNIKQNFYVFIVFNRFLLYLILFMIWMTGQEEFNFLLFFLS